MNHKARLKRLQLWLKGQTTSALLLTHHPDVLYLCGFSGSNALLLVTPRAAVLYTDGRYTTQAGEQTAGSGVRVVIGKGLLAKVLQQAVRAGAEQVGYDGANTTVAQLQAMEKALPENYSEAGSKTASKAARRRFFVPLANAPVAKIREIKDADELALVERAAALGCTLFEQVLPKIAPGVPERAIAAELEYAARRLGADGMSFDTIVASGPRSALPHGTASDRPLPRRGFVTLDFGVILNGYCSDMTRTVYLGKPTREERHAYESVLAAELAGVAAIRSGVAASEVDRAARDVLKRQGLAKHFSHSTGHGVGLEIHEGPRLGAGVQDTLETGMVVTVEPGIYLPGRFGIRIEDMVAVESEGARVLTPAPKELLTL